MRLINIKNKNINQANPAKIFFLAYLIAILLGAVLLSLPISSQAGSWTNFIDAIFTATSAICVTGLATKVTATYWTLFGKFIILALIQLGGIGIVTAGSALGLILRKRFSLKDRMYIAEEKNVNSLQGMVRLVQYVLIATFTIEAIGTALLCFQFVPEYGWSKGILYSTFHSISAYCNAGFDLIGEASLSPYQDNPFVILTIAVLIILGGLGFVVYQDFLSKRKLRKLSLHTKIVLVTSLGLILGGSLLFCILEWNNPDSLASLPVQDKILSGSFQSITTRTAGFSSIDQRALRPASRILTLILMFIGGSPSGTAGGLKTTTIVALVFGVVASIKQTNDSKIFRRRISDDNINKATTSFFISLAWIILSIFILSITEIQLDLSDIIFEVVSAFGTVGLTQGITPMLSIVGKIVISFTMLFGKLGPITMIYLVARTDSVNRIQYAEENILVG